MQYVREGNTFKLRDAIPGSSSPHSIMNLEDVPVIFVWENDKKSRFLFDIYTQNITFRPEVGSKGNALIEGVTSTTIANAAWKMD